MNRFIFLISFFIFLDFGQAQNPGATSRFVSPIDKSLTIKTASIISATDNLGGIYSKPLSKHLTDLIQNDYKWNYKAPSINLLDQSLEELERDPNSVQNFDPQNEVDALIGMSVLKGPKGISLKLDLFLKNTGLILSQAQIRNHPRFELEDLKIQLTQLFEVLRKKIPYSGVVLSRKENRVTLNVGKKEGIKAGQEMNIIQIIQVKRHPKFQFVIGVEKEILGKIRLTKTDDTLSFGQIIFEKFRGVIEPGNKVEGLNFIQYPTVTTNSEGDNKLAERADSKVSFGDNPFEWLPKRPPTYGKISALLGLGSFSNTFNQGSTATSSIDTGALTAANVVYPSIYLAGELWLTSIWSIEFQLKQSVINSKNPKSGSSPKSLNYAISKMNMLFNYSVGSKHAFSKPQFDLIWGFSQYSLKVDTSVPISFTSMDYSGFVFGLRAGINLTSPPNSLEKSVVVKRKKPSQWRFGGELLLFLSPKLKEYPVSSGHPHSQINQFNLFTHYKFQENIWIKGALEVELYSSSFSGTHGRTISDGSLIPGNGFSSSQRYTSFLSGIEYFF